MLRGTGWSRAVALSRFGSFTTPLRGIHSSAADGYPGTATVTFYRSRYAGRYLAFAPAENEKVGHSPLQATTAAQQALWNKYHLGSCSYLAAESRVVIHGTGPRPKIASRRPWPGGAV